MGNRIPINEIIYRSNTMWWSIIAIPQFIKNLQEEKDER